MENGLQHVVDVTEDKFPFGMRATCLKFTLKRAKRWNHSTMCLLTLLY